MSCPQDAGGVTCERTAAVSFSGLFHNNWQAIIYGLLALHSYSLIIALFTERTTQSSAHAASLAHIYISIGHVVVECSSAALYVVVT